MKRFRSISFSLPLFVVLACGEADVPLYRSQQSVAAVRDAFTATAIDSMPLSICTEAKPQSKVWRHHGQWWSVFASPAVGEYGAGTWIRRLDGNHWTRVLKIHDATDVRADVTDVGTSAYFILFRGDIETSGCAASHSPPGDATFLKADYDDDTNNYVVVASSAVALSPYTETVTIAVDSLSRVWLAYDAAREMRVQYAASPYANWTNLGAVGDAELSAGQPHYDDDISAIVAFKPNGTDPGIGLFWSAQGTHRFGFRYRYDSWSASATWSVDENPSAASGNPELMADDHLSLKAASDGTLYAAVKTSFNDAGGSSLPPRMGLLLRRPGASGYPWSQLYGAEYEVGTRPTLLVNESAQRLAIAYTDSEGGGNIVFRESSTGAAASTPIGFSPMFTLINNTTTNNATSTKEMVSGPVPVIAGSADNRGYTGKLCLGSVHTDSLVGKWSFDDGAGSTVLDASTHANNGTLVGTPTRAPGRDGLGLSLNGLGQHVSVANSSSLNTTGSLTLAVWVKPQKVGTQYLLKKALHNSNNGYELSLSAAGQPFVRFNQAASGDTYRLNASNSYPTDGTWVHVAASFDKAAGTARIFVNGDLSAESNFGSLTIGSNSLPLTIGSESSGAAATSFQGSLDEPRVFTRALTALEIGLLASDAPVGSWRFEETASVTTKDYSGACNEGHLVGAPVFVSGGKSGRGLSFDGSLDYVEVADSAELTVTHSFSMAAWVRADKVATQYLIKKATATVPGYELSLSSTGKPFARFVDEGGVTHRVDGTQAYPTNGTFSHLVATYNGATFRLYQNGALVASSSVSAQVAQNSLPLALGAASDGSNKFEGVLDSVKVYRRSLSATETAQQYSEGL